MNVLYLYFRKNYNFDLAADFDFFAFGESAEAEASSVLAFFCAFLDGDSSAFFWVSFLALAPLPLAATGEAISSGSFGGSGDFGTDFASGTISKII